LRMAGICKLPVVPNVQQYVAAANHKFAVMPRLDRGIQYAAAYPFKPRRLWNTGSPDQVGR